MDYSVRAIRDIYGPDFAPGVSGDTRLEALLAGCGATSLADYLANYNRPLDIID